MSDRNRTIGVVFTADTGSLTRGYSVAQAATMSFGKTVESQMWGATAATKGLSDAFSQFDMTSVSSIQKMLTTGFVGYSAFSVLKTIGQNTINLQNEQAQLAAVLESTGRSATMTTESLNEMAAAMSRASTFSGGEITQAQYTLLAFTGIAKAEFPRAMQSAADMAARTGMTIKSAAETIGRALDVPSQGLASLTRQGFRFNEEQKKLVEHLEATGRTAEAQAIILNALEESYKGAAQAARDTFGGAWASLLNTAGDLATGSDGFFAPITAGLNELNDVLSSGEAQAAVHGLTVGVQLLATVLAGRLVMSLVATSASFISSTITAARYKVALMEMMGVSRGAAVGVTALGVAARATGAAMSLMMGPVGIIAALAGSAALAVYNYRDSLSDTSSVVGDFGRSIDELKGKWSSLTVAQNEALRGEYTQAIREERTKLEQAKEELESALSGFMYQASQGGVGRSEQLRKFYEEVDSAAGDMSQLVRIFREAENAGFISPSTVQSWIDLAGAVDGAERSHAAAQKTLAGHLAHMLQLTAATREAAEAQGLLGEELDKARGVWLGKYATQAEKLAAELAKAKEEFGGMIPPDIEARIRKAFETKGPKAQASELQNLIKRLSEQHAVLGMTADEAERYKITTMAGSAADRARALTLFDQVQAWKEADKAIKQAQESSKIFAATQRELDLFSQSFDIEIAGLGLGDRARELLEKENEIRRDFAERRTKLEEGQQSELTKLDEKSYAERLRMLETSEIQKVQILKLKAAEKFEVESQWVNGLSKGLQDYSDSASRSSQAVASSVGSAFSGMADALSNFVNNGKLDFKSLADSIINDMIRITVQQSITGPLAGLVGNLFGGVSDTSYAPAHGFGGGRAMGGPVAAGKMYEVNELGIPELLTIGNKQMLMMAGQSGYVTPLSANAGVAQASKAVATPLMQQPSVSVQIINNSSQPVTSSQPTITKDALGRMVIEIMLEDDRKNGPYARQRQLRGG
ncbi:phage tail tape measure C-terminal domain-containing protein [Paenalcaligenes suwonensis]|uniref:phage tail tape measure C-terminal domain-containing protein n=1 Tax=Paenalcaligenes suwonensis TaxID=1202713 RepID=UPI00140C526D|nr:phage tail tape measure C-terminal domain-containing protein [Paenalcaligenes suwonensis]NHC62177.1 hypothetical protein [Paenalcaligenes suwonensis]